MTPTTVALELWRFVKRVFRRFLEDHCQTNAAALSFTTLLSLVPLAAVVFSTLSVFPVFEEWAQRLEDFIYQNFIPATGDFVREHLNRFIAKTGRLTAFGLIFLLLSALLLLFTIEETLNKIWRVENSRAFVQRVVTSWAVLTLGPLLIGGSLSVSSYLLTVSLAGEGIGADLLSFFLSFLPFLFQVLAFVLIYATVPNRQVRMTHAVVGGCVGALLFEGTKRAFSLYVLDFGNYEVIYGAVASIPIFFVWVYLSWLVVLIGAEVAAALADRQRDADATTG